MQRTGFRKKTFKEIIEKKNKPKSKVAKKKRATGQIKRFKTILWELCKQITRLRYGNKCYTCGKTGLEGSGWQTGHFIASSVGGASLRYDLRNLRPQCYYCNINLGGNGSFFYKNLVSNEGQQYVDQIFQDKQKIIKADEIWFQEKINEYTLLLQDLQKASTSNL